METLAAPVVYHLAANLTYLFIIYAAPEASLSFGTTLQIISLCGMFTIYAALALVYTLGMIKPDERRKKG
jgi:hypothetical protein